MRSSLVRSLLLGAVAPVALALAAAAQTGPPNILLIVMDDTGVNLFGAYNRNLAYLEVTGLEPNEHQVTPNIEALAEQGLLFRNLWSTPLCTPTRTTLFTGLYGFRTGVITNGIYLDPSRPTLTRRLRDEAPYAVREAIGKWHLSSYYPLPDYGTLVNTPTQLGFTRYQGSLSGGYVGYSWPSDPPPSPLPNPPIPTYSDYLTSHEISEAIGFVQQPHTGPWFLWLALHAAHSPWTESETPTLSPTCNSIAFTPRRVRCRQLEVMDNEIGNLIAAIDLGTTTVILVGDNGTADQGQDIPGTVNRGGKGTVYEGGINVPLIVAGAGVSANDPTTIEETDALVHTTDIFATVLDLAGVAAPNQLIDGVSFEPVLYGSPGPRSYVYTDGSVTSGTCPVELPSHHDVAIRDITYKLIRRASTSSVHDYQFYNLVTDPSESIELPESGAEFEALKATIDQFDQEATASPCVPPPGGGGACGVGPELMPALWLLFALRRRDVARRRVASRAFERGMRQPPLAR